MPERPSIPRYSRGDFAEQVHRLTLFASEADEDGSDIVEIHVSMVRSTAAMLSEAANRAPTHKELVAMIEAEKPSPAVEEEARG